MNAPTGPADNEPAPDAWLEIAVEVAGIDSEVAADLLRQACPGGVAIESPSRLDRSIDAYVVDGDAPAVVRGYIPAAADSARLRQSLRLALNMAPLQQPPRWRRARRLRENVWRQAYKKHFGVQKVGRAMIIAPSWTHYALTGRETVVQIDPGMAFGTGQHPTTVMCLRALEELLTAGMSVLDLGCGSGILAIAAAKLGAGRVLALDTDDQAVKAATENVAANGVAALVHVRPGTLDDSRHDGFDIIVANISGMVLRRLAPAFAGALHRGGLLISSGFLEDTVAEVIAAYESAGLAVERCGEEGVWRAVIARRPAA